MDRWVLDKWTVIHSWVLVDWRGGAKLPVGVMGHMVPLRKTKDPVCFFFSILLPHHRYALWPRMEWRVGSLSDVPMKRRYGSTKSSLVSSPLTAWNCRKCSCIRCGVHAINIKWLSYSLYSLPATGLQSGV